MGASFKHITNRISKKLGVSGDGDLQVCFGSSEKGQYWYFVTNAPNIWKWARFKPFRKNAAYADHYDDTNSARLAGAASVNYGLSAPSVSAAGRPLQTLSSGYNTWVYANPRGTGYNEPLRVQDFEGYNGEATPPVNPPGDITIQISSSSSFSFGAYVSHNVAGGDAIAWGDLPASVGNYYLCVIFGKADLTESYSGTLLAKTSSQKINTNGLVLDITHNELESLRTSGYNHYYLVARSAALSGLVDPGTNTATYLALPSQHNSTDLKGAFNIQAAAITSLTIASVATMASPTSATRFANATNFIGPESATPTQSQYMKTGTEPYYLHVGLSVTAGGSNVTILNPKITLTQTFMSGSGFTRKVSCTLYDSSFTQKTQVVIPAGQTQTIYLVASAPILSLTAQGTQETGATNQRFGTTVRIYNGDTLIDATNTLRVRNYDF